MYLKLHQGNQDTFQRQDLQQQVSPTITLLENVLILIKSMYSTQKTLSNELYDNHEKIIRILIDEIFSYNSISTESLKIEHVARITGSYLALASQNEIPEDYSSFLNNTLNEATWRIWSYTNIRSAIIDLIEQMTDIKKNEIEIQYRSSKIECLVIRKNNLSPETINKIKLLQQLTRVYISK